LLATMLLTFGFQQTSFGDYNSLSADGIVPSPDPYAGRCELVMQTLGASDDAGSDLSNQKVEGRPQLPLGA